MSSEDSPSFEPHMQIDEPADGYTNPTMLTVPVPPTQPRVSISDKTLQSSCKLLEHFVNSCDDDDDGDAIQEYLGTIWIIVHRALEEDPDLSIRRVDEDEFLKNIGEYGEAQFLGLLRDMAKRQSWRDFFGNAVFLKKPEWSLTPALMNASVRAWNTAFKGEAANVLIAIIASYLGQRRKPDSMQTFFVNSSGTGKSRIVHEVARKIITVPMCLRLNRTQGFPPPDIDLRGWLVKLTRVRPNDQGAVAKKLHDFMFALLTVLLKHLQEIESKEHLEGIKYGECRIPRIPSSYDWENRRLHEDLVKERQAKLASKFCDLMTSDISFESHNDYRVQFYKDVMIELEKRSQEPQESHIRGPIQYIYEVTREVKEAGERLCQFIDPIGVLDANDGPRWPLVILAFDESHILTEFPESCDWTLFSELCRTLEAIVQRPIFSLFLSTAGSFHQLSRERKIISHPSNRVINPSLYFLGPITEISFDDLAHRATEDTVSLSQVVTTDWICHLGRPLFGAYYDALAGSAGNEELLLLAKQKLLYGGSRLVDGDSSGSLACLSVRFSLELNEDAISRGVAHAQVRRHIRLCLAATAGFEILKTINGSEPLLAEAASQVMYDSGVNPVRHLAKHPDLHCLDGRWRGELVVALLLMQARDTAVRTQSPTQRWVSISDFMQALLPKEKYLELQGSLPTSWCTGEDRTFVETFQDYAMWFNHIIRIEEDEMINTEYLWMFVTRGAMIINAHNQNGVDIVLPLCLRTGNLSRKTVSAIVIQVKNSGPYGYDIEKTLFNRLCPFEVGLFDEGSTPRPVIRMVFTLASSESESGVRFPDACEHPCAPDHGDFTTFDIWCAGLSSFKNIDEDLTSYQTLLDRLLLHRGVLDLEDDKYLDDETRQYRRLLRERMIALPTSQDEHH